MTRPVACLPVLSAIFPVARARTRNLTPRSPSGGSPVAEPITIGQLFDLAGRQWQELSQTLATLRYLITEGGKRTCGDPECDDPAHRKDADT